MPDEPRSLHRTFTSQPGSKFMQDIADTAMRDPEGVRIGFGVNRAGTHIAILVNNPMSELAIADAEIILESFKDTLETARKIRSGEITVKK